MYISEERCEAELARNREWRQDKSKERHEKERARKRAWRQTIILSRERREVEQAGKEPAWWRKDYFIFSQLLLEVQVGSLEDSH